MNIRIMLEGLSSDPSRARHEVQSALDADGYTGDTDGILLLVSELTTNAVRHGSAPIVLVLDRVGTSVDVSVEDDSLDDVPTVRHHEGDEPSVGGYGLQIVEQVADAWGWAPTPAGGKRVWFSME